MPRDHFNPRAPCGARRPLPPPAASPRHISIHAPLRGATALAARISRTAQFQSTRPLRGATRTASTPSGGTANFNPRAPCGARRIGRRHGHARLRISIHAPLAGRDCDKYCILRGQPVISIHAPLAGRDELFQLGDELDIMLFQSTRPLRGATYAVVVPHTYARYFNPRAPCGARLRPDPLVRIVYAISIHAPLAGRDLAFGTTSFPNSISIHAPLAGRDSPAAVNSDT